MNCGLRHCAFIRASVFHAADMGMHWKTIKKMLIMTIPIFSPNPTPVHNQKVRFGDRRKKKVRKVPLIRKCMTE